MPMKIIYEAPASPSGFVLKIWGETLPEKTTYAVEYGAQFFTGLTCKQAAHEFGECFFHRLACDNVLNP